MGWSPDLTCWKADSLLEVLKTQTRVISAFQGLNKFQGSWQGGEVGVHWSRSLDGESVSRTPREEEIKQPLSAPSHACNIHLNIYLEQTSSNEFSGRAK